MRRLLGLHLLLYMYFMVIYASLSSLSQAPLQRARAEFPFRLESRWTYRLILLRSPNLRHKPPAHPPPNRAAAKEEEALAGRRDRGGEHPGAGGGAALLPWQRERDARARGRDHLVPAVRVDVRPLRDHGAAVGAGGAHEGRGRCVRRRQRRLRRHRRPARRRAVARRPRPRSLALARPRPPRPLGRLLPW